MKHFRNITAIIAIFLFINGCGSVPITGRRQMLLVNNSEIISTSFMQYNNYIRSAKLSTNKKRIAMVKRVGQKIAAATERYLKQNGLESEIASLKWEFNLVNENQVNAFCMPGGKIVVFEGILNLVASDDELAVIIGHEVAHAIAKHGNERMSQEMVTQYGAAILNESLSKQSQVVRSLGTVVFGLGTQIGVMLPYSRKHELEADHLGLVFMTLAGYNPEAAVTFWKKMGEGKSGSTSDLMRTHPNEKKRVEELQKLLPQMKKYRS